MNAPVKLRPEAATVAADPLALLRAPFAAHHISKLPKPTKAQTDLVKADFKKGVRCKECGAWHHPDVVHLDYVGHAALTDRLLDVDPSWSWEPVAFRDGLPAFDSTGGLWIKLTVCGVTRLGYGHAAVKPNQDPGAREKEVIGDALRNAAMRFGAALDLWHKGDLHASETEDEPEKPTSRQPAPSTAKGADAPKPPTLAQRADRLESALRSQTTLDGLRKAMTLASGLQAQLSTDMPKRLTELETLYQTLFERLDEPPPETVDNYGIGADEIPY